MASATKVTCGRKGREEEEEGGMFETERGDQWMRPHTGAVPGCSSYEG